MMAAVFDVCFGAAGVWWSLCAVLVLILCVKRKPSQKSTKRPANDDCSRLTDSAVKLELEAAMKSSNNLGSRPSAPMSRDSREASSNFNASNDLDADPPISVNKPISLGISHRERKAQTPPPQSGPIQSQYVAAPTTATASGERQMVSQYVNRKDPSVRAKKDMETARAKKDMETARAKKDMESARRKKSAESIKKKDVESTKAKKSQDNTKTKS